MACSELFPLYKFLQNEFALNGLEYFKKDCDGKKFSSIPFYLQSRIESTNLVAYVINPGTPHLVKLNIFKRINKIGKQRNREEIRDAFFRDSVSKCIAELAESPEFLQATHELMSRKGMADRELVCRYFAFRQLADFFLLRKLWMISWIRGWMDFYICMRMILRWK